jgi:hypothetical protein
MSAKTSAGTGLKRFGIALIVLGGIIYGLAGGADSGNPLAFVGPLVMIAGLLLHFRGRRQAVKARAEGPDSPLHHSGNTVLYLRSFQSDPSTMLKELGSGFTTEEEQLAGVLRPIGELIAVGRPGEKLPIPGAARMYVSDSEWQSAVLEHMRTSRLVVLRAGPGHGLFWELREALSELRPNKFVVLILNMKASEYRVFAAEVWDNLRLQLPALESNSLWKGLVDFREPSRVTSGFVRFSDDWTPEFLLIPFKTIRFGYNDLRAPLNEALKPVFASLSVAWHSLGRF